MSQFLCLREYAGTDCRSDIVIDLRHQSSNRSRLPEAFRWQCRKPLSPRNLCLQSGIFRQSEKTARMIPAAKSESPESKNCKPPSNPTTGAGLKQITCHHCQAGKSQQACIDATMPLPSTSSSRYAVRRQEEIDQERNHRCEVDGQFSAETGKHEDGGDDCCSE